MLDVYQQHGRHGRILKYNLELPELLRDLCQEDLGLLAMNSGPSQVDPHQASLQSQSLLSESEHRHIP